MTKKTQTEIDFSVPVQESNRFSTAKFSGSDYVPALDKVRLTGQLLAIFNVMRDGKFRTLSEIKDITGYGEASISAQLRNAKKRAFGSHILNKRRRGEEKSGLWEYQLQTNDK